MQQDEFAFGALRSPVLRRAQSRALRQGHIEAPTEIAASRQLPESNDSEIFHHGFEAVSRPRREKSLRGNHPILVQISTTPRSAGRRFALRALAEPVD